MEKGHYEVAAIAAKVGKSESYVYQRIKLAELIEPAQKAFLEDRITAGHAILIARLQPKDQKRTFEECFSGWQKDEDGKSALRFGVRQLSSWIQENVHLDLHAAPFKKDFADLVPAAGPCTSCRKRTGFVPALFPDIAHKDTCTDPECYKGKIAAHIAVNKAEIEAKGTQFIEVSTSYEGSGKKSKAGDPLTEDKWTHLTKQNRCDSAQKAIVVAGHRDLGRIIEVCADPECKKHHGQYSSHARSPQELDRQRKSEEKRKREQELRRRLLAATLEEYNQKAQSVPRYGDVPGGSRLDRGQPRAGDAERGRADGHKAPWMGTGKEQLGRR